MYYIYHYYIKRRLDIYLCMSMLLCIRNDSPICRSKLVSYDHTVACVLFIEHFHMVIN